MHSQQQIDFLKQLIQCESITPKSEEAIDLIINKLLQAKFTCKKLVFNDDKDNKITNLYAYYGSGEKNLCFSGHVDVVPPGDPKSWHIPPFEGAIKEGKIFGRGAIDMKSGLVACIFAVLQYIEQNPDNIPFKISFLISGDEEWGSKGGMIQLLDWLRKNNHKITACLVAEPTSHQKLADTIKNGSRGSLLFDLTIQGIQGHVAYHSQASNPITTLVNILHDLKKLALDNGTEFFEPSNLEITNLEVNNKIVNVIPAQAQAQFCIRFNDLHSKHSLSKLVHNVIQKYTNTYSLTEILSGEAYKVDDSNFINTIQKSIKDVLNFEPIVSAKGATSDARFIKNLCPVIELGPLINMAHKKNEHIDIKDFLNLTKIYYKILENYSKLS
ncbi:MAG: succinyl-diaminopimelate desuccinylase [Rickettsiales bacterium]|nr:succinyl-diaminopimelate desuccinylase [Rickettsiales bacterium]